MSQQTRGLTQITSVSVSKEFIEIIKKYNLSPTEIFRRGVAVCLFDLGETTYNSELNKLRKEKSDLIIKELEIINKLREQIEHLT